MAAARVSILAILSCFATTSCLTESEQAWTLSGEFEGITEIQDAGLTAPLSEAGYQQVAELKNDQSMQFYVMRLLDARGMVGVDNGKMEGFLPWYSGTKAVQSFEQLSAEILMRPWVIPRAELEREQEKLQMGGPFAAQQLVEVKAASAESVASAEKSTLAALGPYRVTYADGVPVTEGSERHSKVVAKLPKDLEINVVEIGKVEESRLRVRISDPAGWISLKQTALNMDYASPVVQAGHDCKKYCSAHKVQWQTKCKWDTNHCSGCAQCGAVAPVAI